MNNDVGDSSFRYQNSSPVIGLKRVRYKNPKKIIGCLYPVVFNLIKINEHPTSKDFAETFFFRFLWLSDKYLSFGLINLCQNFGWETNFFQSLRKKCIAVTFFFGAISLKLITKCAKRKYKCLKVITLCTKHTYKCLNGKAKCLNWKQIEMNLKRLQ